MTITELADGDFLPVVCPNCGEAYSQEPWPQACAVCQAAIDLEAQFAYCRGHDAFAEGQDLLYNIYRRKFKKNTVSARERQGIAHYVQAYSALQCAFQGELTASQRELAIEMMAAIAKIFQVNLMISPIEEAYWTTLLVQSNSKKELAQRQQKLSETKPSLRNLPVRWRAKERIEKLERGLADLEKKIAQLEGFIGFADSMNEKPLTP